MNKNVIIIIHVLLLAAGCSRGDISDYTLETRKASSPVPYSYTIFRDMRASDEDTVLYYMPGSGGDENSWVKSHQGIINEWRKSGKPSPVVVCLSIGPRWALMPRSTGRSKSGYLELFINTIMPEVEKTIGRHVKHRLVMGVSNGALSASQLVFRYPELFDRGVIITPPIYPFSVFSDRSTIDEFIAKEGPNINMPGIKNWFRVNVLKQDILGNNIDRYIWLFKNNYYPDRQAYEKGDILSNIRVPARPFKVKVYISCGRNEENGFHAGAQALALKAGTLSYDVTWRSLDGGHLSMDEMEIAHFLVD